MSLTTCNVLCTVHDDAGQPVQGATVSAKLNQFEVYNGYVVPQVVEGTTNATGQVTLALWPNQLGSTESMYVVKIAAPNGKRLTVNAVVPNASSTELHLIAELPPYDGKSDGQLILDAAVSAGSTAIAKAAEASASASNAASSAALAQDWATKTSAEVVTGQGYGAKKYALDASSMASAAEIAAAGALAHEQTAAEHSLDASTSADNANTSATSALASKDSATASATAAAGSASDAATQASNAATSASTATTQAGDSTTQAGIATTQAGIATTKASEATTSASAASVSAAAAQNSATASAGSATAANTSAGSAAGSASSALAIYGTTNAQQAALVAAQSAASLAQGYALSASSAIQQDLSGVTAQALHRSPNAVTAMFVYDTSKDSDGGAWTEKCQHTSWYNEALNGKWLGAAPDELSARLTGVTTTGAELVTNGTFISGVTGWTANGNTLSVVNGQLQIVGAAFSYQAVSVTIGKTYAVKFDFIPTAVNPNFRIGFAAGANSEIYSGSAATVGKGLTFTATTSTIYINIGGGASGSTSLVDNISVREVTALTTASGDYYQSTADGKFYRLWKNLLRSTSDFGTGWSITGGLVKTLGIADPLGGTGAASFNFTIGNAGQQIYYGTTTSVATTDTVWLRCAAGATVFFGAFNNGTVIGGTVAVTSTWTKFTLPCVATPSGDCRHIWLYADAGVVLQVFQPQVEYGSTATAYEAKTVDGSISETFRGNKADFPRLAGIVCQGNPSNSSQLVIYDLTEPGRPMWMTFVDYTNRSAGAKLLDWALEDKGWSHAAMMNGWLIGLGSDNSGMCHFIKDWIAGANGIEFSRNRVSDRNAIGTAMYTGRLTFNMAQGNSSRSISMLVEPGAPVEPETGLPRPSVALGSVRPTYNGPTGSMAVYQTTTNYDDIVFFPGVIGARRGFNSFSPSFYYTINPGSASAVSGEIAANSAPDFALGGNTTKLAGAANGEFLRAPSAPLVQKLKFNRSAVARSATSTITNTYNTGHLIGDIRRAYLADTDVGSAGPSTELINTNGFFSATYYADATVSVSGDVVTLVTGSAYNNGGIFGAALVQVSNLVVGKTYALTITVPSNVGISLFSNASGSGQIGPDLLWNAGAGTFTFLISPTVTMLYVGVKKQESNATVVFSKPSLQIREYDRSYKAASAPITGTLTKTQVAAASQLVAYSGFSAANYLREPYSVDLDFGTGEWSASAWVNVPVTLTGNIFPVIGAELVTNGDMASSTGWTLSAGASIASGKLTLSTTGPTDAKASQSLPTVSGKRYAMTVTKLSAAGATGTQSSLVLTAANGGGVFELGGLEPGTYTFYPTINYTGNTGFAVIVYSDTPVTSEVNNFSIKELGPVLIAERSHSSGPRIQLGVTGSGQLTATAFDGTTTRTVTTAAAYNTATWIKPEAVYTTDGTLAIRVNGVEVAATRGTPLLTLNNANAVLTIGNSYAADAPFPGSIALLKLSATVPTAEQSQWMYEQEKQMFRDGAQVTLPDAGSIVDLTYDDATDKWIAVSAANESEWSGLVRTSVTPSPAGSYTKVSAASGVQLQARSTTSPGVDISIPAYGLREELVRRAESAARLARNLVSFDYVGGFTANTTTGSTAIASVASLTYPVSYIGARISGAGIPANTTVVAVSGTTIYMSAAATATASAVQISFVDFNLPLGYEAKSILSAGATKVEGATKDFTRLFDGFKETIRFGTAPGFNVPVQIQATRSAQ